MAALPKKTIFNFKEGKTGFWKSRRTIILVIIILLIAGGVFFWAYKKEGDQGKYDTTPTEWSQKEDYKIIESPKGKIVKNEKAGLSFEVPEGWKVKKKGDDVSKEYWIELQSPDVEFDKNNFLTKGCGIGIEIIYQKTSFNNINASINYNLENPDNTGDETVIEIDGRSALKTTLIPEDPKTSEKIGEVIQIRIPFDENGVVSIGTNLLPSYQERCSKKFEQFLDTVRIK